MRYFAILLLVLACLSSVAQRYMDTNDPREIKSLLSKENDLNAFGGADAKITDLHGERALIVGGYGGVLVNRKYMLGIAGYGIATNPEFEGELPEGLSAANGNRMLTINGGYAGVLIGGIIFTRELMHIAIPIVLGAGEFQISDEDFFQNSSHTDYTVESSMFLLAEPGAQVEFNLTRTFRVALGVTYRLVEGVELINLRDDDLTEWTGMISVRFGRF